MNIPRENSSWKKVKELGQGGFGFVCLFHNEVTDQFIALKKLRFRPDQDISPKVWERWETEVFMMNKLDHRNVIKAVAVPPELDAAPGDSLVLGMEFCNGGDLRKLLMRPEHCCGLRESYIRDILSDVGGAVEYLHSIKIIHRDIKPENIVLHPIGDNDDKFLYKIIDLGYAKELDASSVCISHVGTQQYLAPELYGKQPYTRTVDYWSFGSLVFECITGKRPFLPDLVNVQWHKEVSKKSPDDITAFYDEQGEVRFSKSLPETNYLCRPLCKYLEQWLSLMLRWDPKSRGGGVKVFEDKSERPKCFCVLERIFEIQILHVLYTKANHLLSFPVNGDHTMATVHQAIEAQIHIPVTQQRLISRDGQVFLPNHLAINACKNSSSECPSVFLFSRDTRPEDLKKEHLPPSVGLIVKEPKIVLSFQAHKEAWKNVVCWCVNEKHECSELLAGHRAFCLAVLKNVTDLQKQVVHMNDKMKELKSLIEYFQMSLQFDVQQCEANESSNEEVVRMKTQSLGRWMQAERDAIRFLDLETHVSELDSISNGNLIPRVTEMGKYSAKEIQPLETCEKNAKKLYDKLKQNKDTLDHEPMVDIVGQCMVKKNELTETLHSKIGDMSIYFDQVKEVLHRIEILCNDIFIGKQTLTTMQKERQENVWKIAASMSNPQNLNLTADTSMSFSNLGNLPSLCNQIDSIQLVDDSKTAVQMVDELLGDMTREQEEFFVSLQVHAP